VIQKLEHTFRYLWVWKMLKRELQGGEKIQEDVEMTQYYSSYNSARRHSRRGDVILQNVRRGYYIIRPAVRRQNKYRRLF